MGSKISANTRFSITLNGEYVAIVEVQLPAVEYLENGELHPVSVRILAEDMLDLDVAYVVRDPLHDIGLLRLHEIVAA